ncbi:MAG: hypothetical protein FD123_2277 [Bacteroidetes bacterium]|nr:MAG: hypothetical protein FD123_2277 [Bacteroidota bacterium]
MKKQLLSFFFSGIVFLYCEQAFAQWTPQVSGTLQNLYSVCGTSTFQAWATGSGGTIRTTSDGGQNWTGQTSGTGETLFEVCMLDASNGWISGGNGTILKTTDGGLNWNPQTSGTNNTLWCIYFINSADGWACGAGGTILHTTDGGVNWNPQASNFGGNLWTVRFVSATEGWMTGDSSKILHTSDGGTNWTPQTCPVTNTVLWSVCMDNSPMGVISGDNGLVLHTYDGGVNWVQQNSGTSNFLHWIASPQYLFGGIYYAVGGNGTIRLSTDGGLTWTSQNSPTNQHLRSFWASAPLDIFGWAVGEGGVILRVEQPLSVNSVTHAGIPVSVSPNPFAETTRITITDPQRNQTANSVLSVYNIAGELLAAYTFSGNDFELARKNLPAGMYFLQLEQNGATVWNGKLVAE